VNRWDAFIAVCGHLRAGLLGGEPAPQLGEVSWELLVEASSHHRVTPALAWCLKGRVDVPAEARDYLDAILALNARRNEALLAMLARVSRACNSIGIEPVPLKGVARLVEKNYPARSLRFLGDLDVLIPAERSADVVAALQAIGFDANPDDEALPSSHHLPMLYDREAGGGVELHTDVVGGDGAEVIPTAWFRAGTLPCVFENLRFRLPDATRSVGHIIAHDQLQHAGYRFRSVELRQVLDLAVIRAGHEGAIDWAELDQRFCRFGLGEVLATYLAIAEALLGQVSPPLRCTPRPRAIEDFRRTFEWRRSQHLASIVARYVHLRRRDPGGLLRLFGRRKWPLRIRMVVNAFKRRPPDW
jgi:Uncharacterised nucleotidyltransferase